MDRFGELKRILEGLPPLSPVPALNSPPLNSPPLNSPPPNRSAAAVARLNARWLAGTPSNDLSEAGVIMWVVDGDGRYLDGMNTVDPWRAVPDSPTGDRHSASLVSKRHPYVFACFACHSDFKYNPGLVLAPSEATRSRLMCSVHADIGTVRYRCNPMGRSATCSPGCSQALCGRDPPWKTWMCSWPPEDLQRMMDTHDKMGTGYDGPLTSEQKYNELVFASMGDDAWEEDLGQMVEAVFVQKRGNQKSLENARMLRQSLLKRIGAVDGDSELPLVEYDPSENSTPFKLLE